MLKLVQKTTFPVDTGHKVNVHKTFRRCPGRHLNVLCTLNSRPVSTRFVFQSLFRVRIWNIKEFFKNVVWKYFLLLTVIRLMSTEWSNTRWKDWSICCILSILWTPGVTVLFKYAKSFIFICKHIDVILRMYLSTFHHTGWSYWCFRLAAEYSVIITFCILHIYLHAYLMLNLKGGSCSREILCNS